jgi:glycosyltransferase involved in cell wall biosynthesis
MTLPSVSVVMPVWNGARYLGEALQSIQAQTLLPLEMIIVDDSSADGTGEIVRAHAKTAPYPVRHIVRPPGSGVYTALNLGIGEARGDLIAFLSYDDRWLPHKLESQVAHMVAHSHLEYVVARFEYFLDPGAQPPASFNRALLGKVLTGRILEALLVRRALFARIGDFSTEYVAGSDVDWYERAASLEIPMAVMLDVLVHKRIHDVNYTNQHVVQNNAELLRIVRRSIHRRDTTKAE